MTDNIFHDMREQMTPSAEATERLKAAVEAEPSGLYRDEEQHEEGSGGREATAQHTAAAIVSPSPFAPFETTAATGKGSAKRRHFFTLYLSAAAAFFLVLIASGVLIANYLSSSALLIPWRQPSVMSAGEVRAPVDYRELYRIVDEELSVTPYYEYMPFGSDVIVLDSVASNAAPLPSVGQGAAITTEAVEPLSSPSIEDSAAATFEPTGSAGEYSETNVQVSGIDEGDIVKTDGAYIYVLSRAQAELVIFKASGAGTEEVSRTQIALGDASVAGDSPAVNSYPQELYVNGSTLVAIIDHTSYSFAEGSFDNSPESSSGETSDSTSSSASSGDTSGDSSSSTSSSSSDSSQGTFESEARAVFYDISDPEGPKLMTEFSQSGNFRSSRLYGGTLYLISSYYLYGDISGDDPGSFVPMLGEGDDRACIAVEDIRIMPKVQVPNYTVVTSYDTATHTRLDQKSVLGEATTVYMSYANLYLGSSVFISEVGEPYQESVYTIEEHIEGASTQIVRIGINEGIFDAAAQCIVKGTLLNQFSLDEYEGNLRLVATVDDYGYRVLRDESQGIEVVQYNDDSSTTNALYVLDPSLRVIGSITGMAEYERIYSARFTGPVGYMVTYRQMDPLFAIDLSDPTDPKVTSELKIPGFSTYLHPFGEGHLLGFGYDAEGSMRDGMKLSMFDISDPFDVTESFAQSVNASDSEALNNHKAVLVDTERNIIGFPGYTASGGLTRYFVYRYDDAEGFALRDELVLGSSSDSYYSYEIRGLFIDDFLYIVSDNYLDVFDLETLQRVASLEVRDASDPSLTPTPLSQVEPALPSIILE
jgi:uncharacterized secreted protein with C-terminal beta-propeller domain